MTFATPVRDMRFLLDHACGFDAVSQTGAFDDLSPDLVEAVLTEAGRFADEVLEPLNWPADQAGTRLENGQVITAAGFKEAYDQYVEAGWNGLAFPEAHGGQGLPETLSLAVFEAMSAACTSFALNPLLTKSAVKAVLALGTDEQKALYLEKLVTAEWAGTMNLTEPHAGSDLSDLKTKAEPIGDGTYAITGSKIYISYGDHSLSDNIVHLVLARLPDAPEGTRGVSMFLVPKRLVHADGSLGVDNNVRCIGLEHKLGQHAAPTCTLSFGEGGPSIGTLIGEENKGLRNMFIMMNAARIGVGAQGSALAERAYQKALSFAQERKQGRPFGVRDGDTIPIIQHPDVRRNLMTMKALTDASRAINYATMIAYDVSRHAADEETRQAAREREELLTPIAKSFGSDRGLEVTNIGVQIHGGMGFVEETGAAQHSRDIRITTIYEGTNGIQAIDLVGRKLAMAEGKLALDFLAEAEGLVASLRDAGDGRLNAMGDALGPQVSALRKTTEYVIEAINSNPEDALAAATPYQDQFGYVVGAFFLARSAQNAVALGVGSEEAAFYEARTQIATFYMDNILPRAAGFVPAVKAGADATRPIDPALLTG